MAFAPNYSDPNNTVIVTVTTSPQFITRPAQTPIDAAGVRERGGGGTTSNIRNVLIANSSANSGVIVTIGRAGTIPTPSATLGLLLPPSWTQTFNLSPEDDTVGIVATNGSFLCGVAFGNSDGNL